jgi:hypothetical protein
VGCYIVWGNDVRVDDFPAGDRGEYRSAKQRDGDREKRRRSMAADAYILLLSVHVTSRKLAFPVTGVGEPSSVYLRVGEYVTLMVVLGVILRRIFEVCHTLKARLSRRAVLARAEFAPWDSWLAGGQRIFDRER